MSEARSTETITSQGEAANVALENQQALTRELGARIFDNTNANVSAVLALTKKLARARSVQEAISIQSSAMPIFVPVDAGHGGRSGFALSSAVHALTAGAIAAMILAVTPRLTLGHTGRTLTANRAAVAAFVLINGAFIVRACATWHTAQMANLLLTADALWIAAFLLFELIYGPMLLTRRRGS